MSDLETAIGLLADKVAEVEQKVADAVDEVMRLRDELEDLRATLTTLKDALVQPLPLPPQQQAPPPL